MPGADEFEAATHYLEDQVGQGDIVAGCFVNQDYAQDQHETPYYHPRGGRMNYLGGPLMENSLELVGKIARTAITETGSDIPDTMREISEEMAGYVATEAPVLSTDLRRSGSPYVMDDGVEVYRRPPLAPRRNN